MKNLYSKNEFLKVREDLMLNEGLISKIQLNEGFFGFMGKMLGKIKNQISKTKGGKEVEAIYQKYIKIINDQIKKKTGVGLELGTQGQDATGGQPAKPDQNQKPVKESFEVLDEAIGQAIKQGVGGVKDAIKQGVGGVKDAAKQDVSKVKQGVGNKLSLIHI